MIRQTARVDEHVMAPPDSAVSSVCHCAAQLIGLNDIFHRQGNKVEETELSKVLIGQLQSVY